jgi:acyl carrier protein
MPVAPEIYAQVTSVLAEALVVDKEDITPTAALQRDLGADSLDLLELMFRLEHEFGIKIPRGELFLESTFRIGPELVQDGKLTDKGVAELRSRLPYADLSSLQTDRRLSAIPDLFTVGLVAAYVAWKLDSRNSEGSAAEPL